MGELEQCVPIIAAVHAATPTLEIIVSCSSPSGVRHATTLPGITAVVYHPFEERHEITAFIAHVQPDVVMIDRYDVWPLFIEELHRRDVPVLLINATLPSSAGNNLLRSVITTTYRCLAHITAVTPDDALALQEMVGHPVSWLPDSRVDRILERVAHPGNTVVQVQHTIPTLIIGSSWEDDLELLIPSIKELPADSLRVIIVPHEPVESTLASIEEALPCTRLSRVNEHSQGHIVVDSVGMLLSLYARADAAYVGGGFGAGVHSVLEPAGYGLPLACGPHIERSRDAVALHDQGACTILRTHIEARRWIHDVVLNDTTRAKIGERARAYVASQTGSSSVYATLVQQIVTERSRATVFASEDVRE